MMAGDGEGGAGLPVSKELILTDAVLSSVKSGEQQAQKHVTSDSHSKHGKRKRAKGKSSDERSKKRTKREFGASLDANHSQQDAVAIPNGITNDSSSTKPAKKEKKKDRTGKKSDSKKHRKSKRKQKPTERMKLEPLKHGSSWGLSNKIAGRYLPIDPLFSRDEQYFILALRSGLKIYSSKNSSLYRKVDLTKYGPVTCVATGLDSTAFVGTSEGNIVHVDWQAGKVLENRSLARRIYAISPSRTNKKHSKQRGRADIIDFICDDNAASRVKQPRRLCRVVWQMPKNKPFELLRTTHDLDKTQTLNVGRIVLATAKNCVYVGVADSNSGKAIADLTFSWTTLQVTQDIVSFRGMYQRVEADAKQDDAEAPDDPVAERKQITTATNITADHQTGAPVLDLAIGTADGAILLYENILQKLVTIEESNDGDASPANIWSPRTLHWHRTAVNAIKWSLDGSYLISGGNEMTLVLWQLKTGRRQELPHLSAAIDCLTVSPSGALYAILLADNSMIILSTSDLEPTAQVTGIQALTAGHELGVRVASADLDDESQDLSSLKLALVDTSPIVLHPHQPGVALLAVSRARSISEEDAVRNKPFLQTFDIANCKGLSQQALTRNFATDPAISPEGDALVEPDITHVQISHDGQWLATVEEWVMPVFAQDDTARAAAYLPQDGIAESFLKFWQWDAEIETWVLQSRITSSHRLEDDGEPVGVFSLVPHPQRLEFTTTGADGVLRVWQAKTRLRNGVVVKGAKGEGLVSWLQRRAIELDGPSSSFEESIVHKAVPLTAHTAYANDGSVIIAAHDYAAPEDCGIVSIIDPSTGMVMQSRSDMFSSGLAGIAVLGRHLIILSDALVVWDLVDDVLEYGYNLVEPMGSIYTGLRKLAVNHHGGTFAIAIPNSHRVTSYRLVVFNTRSAIPEFLSTAVDNVANLLAVPGSSRYMVFSDRAEIYTLAAGDSGLNTLIEEVAVVDEPVEEVKEEEKSSRHALPSFTYKNTVEKEGEEGDGEIKVQQEETASLPPLPASLREGAELEFNNVSRQAREELFAAYPSSALPSRQEMFKSLWDLYVPKAKR